MHKGDVLISIVFILAGIGCFIILATEGETLILNDINDIIARYVPIISLINMAIFSPVLGILFLNGWLRPWYNSDLSEVELARLYIVSAIGCSPTLICIAYLLLTFNESWMIAAGYIIFFIWIIIRIVKSIITLRSE